MAWNLRICLRSSHLPTANLGFGVASCLSLCRSMGLGDLTLFPAGGSFSHGSGFGPAGSLYTLGGCGTSCIFSLTQRPLHGRVRVLPLCSLGCLASCRVRSRSRSLSLSLGQQRLLANLLSGAVPQLGAVLSSRRRKIPILRSMQVRPRIEYRHIFGRLCGVQLFNLVCAARIHNFSSCTS